MRAKSTANSAAEAEAQSRYAKSLNRESRKRELQKITKENARILHAIQSSQPFYDHLKWEREAKEHEKYMANICQLPLALFDRGPDSEALEGDILEQSYYQSDYDAQPGQGYSVQEAPETNSGPGY